MLWCLKKISIFAMFVFEKVNKNQNFKKKKVHNLYVLA